MTIPIRDECFRCTTIKSCRDCPYGYGKTIDFKKILEKRRNKDIDKKKIEDHYER